MGNFQKNNAHDRKPVGKYGGGFGANRKRGVFGRRTEQYSGSFDNRPPGKFRRDDDRPHRRPSNDYGVVCDKCGKETTVPFKPTGTKPVYCRDCYGANASSSSRQPTETREISNYSSDELIKINQKLDKIMKALRIG